MIKRQKGRGQHSLDTYASTRVGGMILWTIVVILIFTRCNTLNMSPQRGNIIKSVLLSRFSFKQPGISRLICMSRFTGKQGASRVQWHSYESFCEDSSKSRGEQRRRARYDAKQRMMELQEAFGLCSSTLAS